MFGHATLRFYGDLADLASDADRSGEARVPVERPRSVKDAIESCGVPHTEVDLVVVNGSSVGFGHLVGAGDRLGVYPPFESIDVPSHVRAPALEPVRFLLDVHLGRLAARLRVLGFDTSYRNDADDDELAVRSVAEGRWLLTRDRGLLMRSIVSHGYLVRSDDSRAQAVEVVRRFRLFGDLRPMSRCPACNGLLRSVDKADVEHRLEPGTRRDHDVFVECAQCRQLYWEGSHVGDLRAFIDEVRAARG